MSRARSVTVAAVLIIAATITTVLLTFREPPPPDPFALTSDGRYQVPLSRTTDGVDPCSLLTTDEVGSVFDEPPVVPSRDRFVPEMCFYTGGETGIGVNVHISTDGLTESATGRGTSTFVTVGGYPARIQTVPEFANCVVVIAVDAVPGRPGLLIEGIKDNGCAAPLRLAELAVSRLPAAP